MSVLSVDLMVGGERCNLMSATAQDLWLRVVREGLALGTGRGSLFFVSELHGTECKQREWALF